MDDDAAERRRIAKVYGRYEQEPRFGAKWDSTNAGNRAIEAERDAWLRERLGARGLLPLVNGWVTDIGCGNGGFLVRLVEWGASARQLVGLDVLPHRLVKARAVSSSHVVNADARSIPLRDGSVRVAVAHTLFSSILDREYARLIAREIGRILEPGGALLWYDYRVSHPLNRNTRGVSRDEIATLFPGLTIDLRTVTVVPQIARRLGPVTDFAYPLLARVPLLRTHYAGVLVKPASPAG